MSPYEHGETFVLDDGGEALLVHPLCMDENNLVMGFSQERFNLPSMSQTDLDLGNYERFIDVRLHRDNNITTGKVYQEVISKVSPPQT